MYNRVVKEQVIELDGQVIPILTKPQENTTLHQLEGGTLSINTDELDPDQRASFFIDTTKVQYILDKYGDTEDLVIFYHFQLEYKLLAHNFKKAKILQGITYSAGVDLHKHRYAVVYSMDYSTANYSQRRNRQVNYNRKDDIIVEYLIVKGAMSESVYNVVAVNKKNFVDAFHKSKEI